MSETAPNEKNGSNKRRRASRPLTLREQEYLALRLTGHKREEIAQILGVTIGSVSSTLTKIKNKIEEEDPDSPVLKAKADVLSMLPKAIDNFDKALDEGMTDWADKHDKDRAVKVAESVLKGTQVLVDKRTIDKRELKLSLEQKRQEIVLEKRLMDQFGAGAHEQEGMAQSEEASEQAQLDGAQHIKDARVPSHPHAGGRTQSLAPHETTPPLRSENSELSGILSVRPGICHGCDREALAIERNDKRYFRCKACKRSWQDPRLIGVKCAYCGDEDIDKWYFRTEGGEDRLRCFLCGRDFAMYGEQRLDEEDGKITEIIERSREEGLTP